MRKNTIKLTVAGSVMAVFLAFSGQTQAVELGAKAGTDFTELNAGMGRQTSGLYIDGNWAKNTKNGRQIGGAATGFNIPVGPAMINLGAKALYMQGSTSDNEGVAFPVGGGITVPFTDSLAFYAEGYSAPDALSNRVKSYTEADAGFSWVPFAPVKVKAGYRYIGLDGTAGNPNERIIDGAYLGAEMDF
ncbi:MULTISPECIES: YfaZ family outer membrane protein [Rahnella]|uniref:Porin n=1 Tax=Rahnella variigena TaxID=574964 RepID=A0ABX9PRG8_9GAMM|nr:MULTISPECIES: YfaZ family outer membrane protein [Rahnella]RJT50859.1 porin [Rahnella variigena]RKF66514.1 porin [Rahnella variigena]